MKNTSKVRSQNNYDREPQFYPQLKRAGSNPADDKTNPRPTRQPKFVYKTPGPADYNISDVVIDKPRTPSFFLCSGNSPRYSSCYNSPSPAGYFPYLSRKGPFFSFSGRHGDWDNYRSPGPGSYSVYDNYATKHTAGFDFSNGWRRQRNKYAVTNTDEDTSSKP